MSIYSIPASDSEAHMWSYWKEKYGLVGALEEYYPITSTQDPEISVLLIQLRAFRDRIDKIMTERAENSEEDY